MSLNLEPRPEDAERALQDFVSGSGWAVPLHPEDERRFWAFAAMARANGWTGDDVEIRLLQCGLSVELGHVLGERFRGYVERADRPRDPSIDAQIQALNKKLTRSK